MRKSISRRNFLGKAATVGAAGAVMPSLMNSCASDGMKEVTMPEFLDMAPDGPELQDQTLRSPHWVMCLKTD